MQADAAATIPRRRLAVVAGPASHQASKALNGRDQKRYAVNSGHRGDLRQSEICGRRVAQQIPRKTYFRQVRADEFESDPHERRAETSELDAVR